MKYQIILESEELLDDQTFKDSIELIFNKIGLINCPVQINEYTCNFKLVEARSLEGIREEVWKKKEELKHELIMSSQGNYPVNNIVDIKFDDLSDLFKIT